MSDYNAKINAKGCDKTGITDDLAAQLFNGGRSTMLAIVELSVASDITDRVSGKKTVSLVIDTIEPVVSENPNVAERAENDLRRIQRALFMNRKLDEGDEMLPTDSTEPVLADVLAAAEALVETDDQGEVTGLWDGNGEPAEPSTVGDPFATNAKEPAPA